MFSAEQLQLVLAELAQERPVFHSEADFQHSFAWALHFGWPEAKVRLELPEVSLGGHLDLVLFSPSGRVALELKYKTRQLVCVWDGERFALKEHGAEDIGRYDFWKDVKRLETVRDHYDAAYAVLLTNASLYWDTPHSSGCSYEAFRTDSECKPTDTLQWGDTAGPGTRKGREAPILLHGTYTPKWIDYSQLDVKPNGKFRYLLIPVFPVEI